MESLFDRRKRAVKVIKILREATKGMVQPASLHIVQKFGRDPFLVLVSCVLSLRTKDTVSLPASCRLFNYAKTPQEIVQLEKSELEKIIYPVGFYRQKARQLQAMSTELIAHFGGKVPKNEADLLALPGVGRKTMNLVLGAGFEIPAICVDTHVHRISNRLGLVQTKTTEETEKALKKLLPQQYWIEYNHLMVIWGQNICVPISPFCSKCAIRDICPRIGVKKSR